MIISVLNRAAGFFSQFFFTMNHYIYCMKNKISFTLKSDDWTFLYQDGWTDYFMPIELRFEDSDDINRQYGHGNVIEDVSFLEYKNILPLVYKYNDFIQSKINEKMDELQLVKGEYTSIFIRRGDKLLCESKFIETEKYMEALMKVYPDCKVIFLQTDDYNCYNDIMKYITTNELNIKVITLCDSNLFGFTMSGIEFYNTNSNFEENNPYIHKIRSMNVKNKIIFDMNKEEIREHMITFLVGLDIVLQSKICITDYSSNVGKFIKLWNGDSVIHVFGEEMNLNTIGCPAY
jgi:hypothetical protein